MAILDQRPSPPETAQDSQTLALHALGWVLSDEARAERLLSLTGLDPDSLRNALSDPAVLAAVLEFLANHEPDLVACADALGITPQALLSAQQALAR